MTDQLPPSREPGFSTVDPVGAASSPCDFKRLLFVDDPFRTIELDGIDGEGIDADLQGWGANHGIFRLVIEELRPATIIELGTWKGASAIHMAKLCREFGIDAQILCVDNFIGFPSFYFQKEKAHEDFKLKGGFPRLYWTFMRNVVDHGVQDMITPLVQQTAHAARICAAKNVRADLIYVDGDHSYEGCSRDLQDFAPILAHGGVFLCDDYKWEGAGRAIDEFIARTGCAHVIMGNKALLSPRRDISAIKARAEDLLRRQAEWLARRTAASSWV